LSGLRVTPAFWIDCKAVWPELSIMLLVVVTEDEHIIHMAQYSLYIENTPNGRSRHLK
jgi:hypothetical protein